MKIFIQYTDTKLINSLPDINNNLQIVIGDIDHNLYQIHYRYNFDAYIFCADKVDNDIIQFVNEFSGEKRIILYHKTDIDQNILLSFPQNCKHISDNLGNVKLINKHVFYNRQLGRNSDICCFLDTYSEIPQNLNSLLYPNSKLPIKIYSRNIRHIQSIGYATEKEKAELLNTCGSYLSVDDVYDAEAAACGSPILTISNNSLVEKIVKNENCLTYSDFVLELIK